MELTPFTKAKVEKFEEYSKCKQWELSNKEWYADVPYNELKTLFSSALQEQQEGFMRAIEKYKRYMISEWVAQDLLEELKKKGLIE